MWEESHETNRHVRLGSSESCHVRPEALSDTTGAHALHCASPLISFGRFHFVLLCLMLTTPPIKFLIHFQLAKISSKSLSMR